MAFAHIHYDRMMKFSPTDVGFVQNSMPLYMINQSSELRYLDKGILQREVKSGGSGGANAMQHYLNVNGGANGQCLDGC